VKVSIVPKLYTHFNLPHPVIVAFGQSNVDRDIVFRVVHIVVHCEMTIIKLLW